MVSTYNIEVLQFLSYLPMAVVKPNEIERIINRETYKNELCKEIASLKTSKRKHYIEMFEKSHDPSDVIEQIKKDSYKKVHLIFSKGKKSNAINILRKKNLL